MAIRASRKPGVIKVRGLPRLRRVTRAAFAGEVLDGRIHLMAITAILGIFVIEASGFEGHIGVAALASQTQLLKLALVLVLVTADAGRRLARGLPADVTLITVDLGVLARKRRSMLRSQFGRQRD